MNKNKWKQCCIGILGVCLLLSCQKSPAFDVDKSLDYCVTQVERSLNQLKPYDYSRVPRNILSGEQHWNLRPVAIEEWCAGFWPGVLWYTYEYAQDSAILEQARNYTNSLASIADGPVYDHDLGFLMFCSFGNGFRLTQDPAYKEVIIKSAHLLMDLYNPVVGTMLSWPREVANNGWPHNTIIDNMINLEMMFWAANHGGDPNLIEIAKNHADKTMQYHFRPDHTCYHVAVYDTSNGRFIKGVTHQGYSDNSMWARGQAWAIYGYTVMYRETLDPKYLDFVQKVAKAYLDRLPEDYVPYWDFDDPLIPQAPRDASAAAITASALIELSKLVPEQKQAKAYFEAAERMLRSLSRGPYQSGTENTSFLKHSTGHKPGASEVDASIIYADYYYIEALLRYRNAIQ